MPKDIDKEFLDLRKAVMEKEFSRMNDRQREAVLTTKGPLLVLAGAGSGKTTVLVNRVACILKYGDAYLSDAVPPRITAQDIEYIRSCLDSGEFDGDRLRGLLAADPPPAWGVLAITFTNKAANEMKERLAKMLGEQAKDIWALTFHSACARMLRRDIENLGLGYTRSFTIYDTDDSVRLLRDTCRDIAGDDRGFITKTLLPSISRAKENNLDPKAYELAAGSDFRLRKVSQAYYRYQDALRRANALDFDDMLMLTVRLFESSPQVLDYYQRRFRYILVDEYQDTNNIQYRLISMLAKRHGNLCVVGDDDQSIYKFRGATIENILNFESQFKKAKVVKLEQNYRSTSVILDAANAVISNNSGRKGKTLWTRNGKGGKINVSCFDDETSESQYIADSVLESVKEGGSFSQSAVLYRMNAQSGSIEKAFVRNGIPYRVVSGYRLIDRLEIRDILAYLKLINNPRDDISLIRIINVPKRGIGEATVAAAQEIAARDGVSLFEVFENCGDIDYFSRKFAKIKQFTDFILHMREIRDTVPVKELVRMTAGDSGYLGALEAENSGESKERTENIGAFISSAAEYDMLSEEHTLEGFLEECALMSDIDNYDSSADTVTMMTVHSAKGLEFPTVFMAGLEEGIFPGQNSALYPEELEEERRLAYVAITRAKKQLNISYARSRMLFGSTVYNRPSRFIAEIPDELKDFHDNRTGLERYSAFAQGAQNVFHPQRTAAAASASSKPGIQRRAQAHESYIEGETVEHGTFGTGMILSVKPMGGDTLLEIAFEKFGTKKLMANFARLKKV
jgi:DNA helicase-2/ATP-dependent DNA helicase PcrA